MYTGGSLRLKGIFLVKFCYVAIGRVSARVNIMISFFASRNILNSLNLCCFYIVVR